MPSTPIIIGIADLKSPPSTTQPPSPLTLITTAINRAITDAISSSPSSSDAASTLRSHINSVDIVRCWTWPYDDLQASVVARLGLPNAGGNVQGGVSEHGGDKPAVLVDRVAKGVARGQVDIGVVAGGEALASLAACAKEGKMPPEGWEDVGVEVDGVFSPTTRGLGENLGATHGFGAPIHVYPLYENALRAQRGQSFEENHGESARLYAEFSRIAEGREAAWGFGTRAEEEEIKKIGGKNRMICWPYPLLLNAFNTVNLSSAIIITSTTTATALSIPESKWIYPLSGAGTSDAPFFWNRPNYTTSPALSTSIDTALALAHIKASALDLIDIYSCFPIVPKLAALHLDIPIQGERLSLIGGLTSFGGAGNNYSMHAITEMARQLRAAKSSASTSANQKPPKTGLVLANGGLLTYMHALVLSSHQSSHPYPTTAPLPAVLEPSHPEIDEQACGEAIVETYTIEFSRGGTPRVGLVVGRLKEGGKRFLANVVDRETLGVFTDSAGAEVVGREGWVWRGGEKGERGVFAFGGRGKL